MGRVLAVDLRDVSCSSAFAAATALDSVAALSTASLLSFNARFSFFLTSARDASALSSCALAAAQDLSTDSPTVKPAAFTRLFSSLAPANVRPTV